MTLEEEIKNCPGGLLTKKLDSEEIVNVCLYSGENYGISCKYLSDNKIWVETGGKLKLGCMKYRT